MIERDLLVWSHINNLFIEYSITSNLIWKIIVHFSHFCEKITIYNTCIDRQLYKIVCTNSHDITYKRNVNYEVNNCEVFCWTKVNDVWVNVATVKGNEHVKLEIGVLWGRKRCVRVGPIIVLDGREWVTVAHMNLPVGIYFIFLF